MRYKQKLRLGIKLAVESFKVVGNIRHLYLLPIMSFISFGVVLAAYSYGVTQYLGGFENIIEQLSMAEDNYVESVVVRGGIALTFMLVTYVLQVINLYFNVATMAAIKQHLDGQQSTISTGLQVAYENFTTILKWALFSFIVGHIIRFISEKLKAFNIFAGYFTEWLMGISFGLATMFVVPTLIFQKNNSIKNAIRKSATMLKEKFGENIVSKACVSSLSFILIIGIFFTLFIGFIVSAIYFHNIAFEIVIPVFFSIFIVLMLLVTLIFGFVNQVLNVILYMHGRDETIVGMDSKLLTEVMGHQDQAKTA